MAPTGAQFGISGAYTVNFLGAFVEVLLEAGLQAPNLQITTSVSGLQIGQTDQGVTGTATLPALGTKAAQVTEPAVTTDLTDATGFTWAAAPSPPFPAGLGEITSPSGEFTAADVGDGVYTGTTTQLANVSGSNQFPTGSQVAEFITANEVLVSDPPTASGGGNDVTLVGAISVPVPFLTSNTAFTTNGTNGSTADIGILPQGLNTTGTAAPQTFGVGVDGILNSGAYAGVPAGSPCVLTGFTAGGAAAGPGIAVATGPPIVASVSYPTGPRIAPFTASQEAGLAPLDSAGNGTDVGTVEDADGVSIPLGVAPPTPASQSINMGIGGARRVLCRQLRERTQWGRSHWLEAAHRPWVVALP